MRKHAAVPGWCRALVGAMTICAAATAHAAEPPRLRVMSFNIRYSYGRPQEPATENDWADPKFPRRERAIR